MKEVKAIIDPSRLYDIVQALRGIPSMPDFAVSEVRIFPRGGTCVQPHGHGTDAIDSVEALKIECVVPEELVPGVVDAVQRSAGTGVVIGADVTVGEVHSPAAMGLPPGAGSSRH